MTPHVTAFFDKATCTFSYVVAEPDGKSCAIVDPVLDFDPKSGRTGTESADRLVNHVQENGLELTWILETHVHADHLSAAPYLRSRLGGRIGIGEHIREVQELFRKIFNTEPYFRTDGSQFDHLFQDGETFRVGTLEFRVMHTPGHTPADVTYFGDGVAFVGDTLFMPDFGTARADFPGGDARTLYRSIRKLLELPPETRLFMCHDYAPGGREYRCETTVAEERANNVHIRDGIGEEDFVRMRTERDRTLDMPVLLLPSVQVNMRAGQFPPPEENGVSYLKIPLNGV